MNNINIVTIAGNIVRDADCDKVCRFSVAVNSTKREGDDFVDYPNYVDCVIFGNFGKAVSDKLVKGAKVFIQGSLHQSRWEGEDGKTRSKLEVWVDNLELPKVMKADDEYDDVPFDTKPAKRAYKKR